MPNHDTNYCVFVGEPEKIDTFRDAVIHDVDAPGNVKDRVFDFERVVEPPENLERGGCSGQHAPGIVCWYEWNIEHWGTKWNAYSFDHEGVVELNLADGRKLIYLTFDTAWGPPTPVFAAIEEKFGIEVHVITLDEGGFEMPDFGDPEQYLDREETRMVWDETTSEYGDERPAVDTDPEDEVYLHTSVDLKGDLEVAA